ncbi:VOC family protein [Nonomuraea sp. NPDC049309]|uniref:VOC family protein n=1 Tax=Nonomuraea sp. NPDC049309 TaxID=3364350 RepID=UPI00371E8B6D
MNLSPRLIVPDPDRASAFYQETLGAERVFSAPPAGAGDARPSVIEHRLGGATFRVSPSVDAWGRRSPDDLGGSAVLIEIDADDPDAVGERMVAHGAEVAVPIENRPYGKRSGRIRDPFGHLWIITGPLR